MLDEKGCVREGGVKKEAAKRLDFSVWMLAWDRYAVGTISAHVVSGFHACRLRDYVEGAAAIHQMDYKAAMKHKAVVAEVACAAAATGQWSILGVLFDEVSRQEVL